MSYPATRAEAIQDERMSDAAIEAEETLMAEYFRKEAAYRDVLAKVGNLSFIYGDKGQRVEAFNDFTHDNCPDPEHWAELIEEEYRG